jgi:glutamate-1-semialdehyde 2,1-aminomutase
VDEVITFRLGSSGYHPAVGLRPDLVALGKIIGGGFPVGAIAGRAEVMSVFASRDGARPRLPAGGTFSANTVTMVAGHACLRLLDDGAFARLAAMGERTRGGIRQIFSQLGFDGQVTGEGSLFRLHPHQRPLQGYREARHSAGEAARMARLHRGLLNAGVAATTYGLGCLSLAMTEADLGHLLGAVHDAVEAELRRPAGAVTP